MTWHCNLKVRKIILIGVVLEPISWMRVLFILKFARTPTQIDEEKDLEADTIPAADAVGPSGEADKAATFETLGEAQVARKPKVFLVVGECGDGKSTLINNLRDPQRSGEAKAGLASRGVTKSIEAYVGQPINGQPIDLLDTPGIGDTDVTPMKVLTLIEQELIADNVSCSESIDGIIVTTPIPDGRVKLGAQVVQMLVEHGFLGEDEFVFSFAPQQN